MPSQGLYSVLAYAGRQMVSADTQAEKESGTRMQARAGGMDEDYKFEKIDKESKNNIQLRGEIIAETRESLLRNIEKAITSKEKQTVHIGGIPEETKNKIEKDIGIKIFKEGQYTIGITYDNIRHIKNRHYNTAAEIVNAINRLYNMVVNYDKVTPLKGDGQTRLKFEKGYDDADYLTINIASKGKRALEPVTIYITKKNERQVSLPDASNDPGVPGYGSPLNTSISSSKENVNKKFSFRASAQDAEYMRAAENGDEETAQRMVDEAARKAGYTEKVYHGTLKSGLRNSGTQGPVLCVLLFILYFSTLGFPLLAFFQDLCYTGPVGSLILLS
ncbi:MAG: hypothetical protein IKP72_18915 [Clostridia bacterium]|nr:hypothetical protein [Clostridia bacterium]